MANFLKCTQEFVIYKRAEKEISDHEVKTVFFFFVRLIPIYKEKEIEEKNYNVLINLDRVKTVSKTDGRGDCDSNGNRIKGTEKPGIYFSIGDSTYFWFYNDEKARDSQFDDIATNIQGYKSKIVL